MARGPVWLAEIVVDATLAAELIAEQFPELTGVPAEEFAAGWDNSIFRLRTATQDWAFRFPRREIAVRGVRREIDLLPRLAPGLPLAIPVPLLVGEPTHDFPWPFSGAHLVAGDDMAAAAVAEAERTAAADALGNFLRVLHDPRITEASGEGLDRDPMNRAYPLARSAWTRERLDRLTKRGSWNSSSEVLRLLDAGDELPRRTDPAVLVHGDLHVRHLLVNERFDAVGVIDWGDTCLADRVVDLSIAYGCFTGEARAAFFESYGHIDADRELRARVLAVSLCAALADHASVVGEQPLLTESLVGLDRAVS